MAEISISGMTVVQAVEDATGWRPEELPVLDGRVTQTGANLRSGPSVNLPVVATIKPQMRVLVLGADQGGWVPVAAVGWISKELLADA